MVHSHSKTIDKRCLTQFSSKIKHYDNKLYCFARDGTEIVQTFTQI